MKTTLVPIGNSRGIRIPKPILDQCGLTGEIDMSVRDGALVIRAPKAARSGWDRAFARMARLQDDRLLDTAPCATRWEKEEWEWM